MIRMRRSGLYGLLAVVFLVGAACHLRRPQTTVARMIEPQLLPEPAPQEPKAHNAAAIRLLDTQSRAHIGRRVLHQEAAGELTEDQIWRWSSAPDRYLDTALRLEVSSSPNMRLVDTSDAPAVAATLLVWDLESAGEKRLVGAVEFQSTQNDRMVYTKVVQGSEPVSAELPGNLAAAAGRLLHRLAAEGLKGVVSQQYASQK